MSWRSLSSEILSSTIVLSEIGDKIYLNEAILLDNELKIDNTIDFIDGRGDNYNTIDEEDGNIADNSFDNQGYFNKCITLDVIDVISKYHNITQLDISHNNIKEIPIEIDKLINIKSFDISHNWLEEIPPQLCNLVNLKRLNLSNNDIKSIPSTIGNLRKLIYLNLSHMLLSTLPTDILKLSLTKDGIDISKNKNITCDLFQNDDDYKNFDIVKEFVFQSFIITYTITIIGNKAQSTRINNILGFKDENTNESANIGVKIFEWYKKEIGNQHVNIKFIEIDSNSYGNEVYLSTSKNMHYIIFWQSDDIDTFLNWVAIIKHRLNNDKYRLSNPKVIIVMDKYTDETIPLMTKEIEDKNYCDFNYEIVAWGDDILNYINNKLLADKCNCTKSCFCIHGWLTGIQLTTNYYAQFFKSIYQKRNEESRCWCTITELESQLNNDATIRCLDYLVATNQILLFPLNNTSDWIICLNPEYFFGKFSKDLEYLTNLVLLRSIENIDENNATFNYDVLKKIFTDIDDDQFETLCILLYDYGFTSPLQINKNDVEFILPYGLPENKDVMKEYHRIPKPGNIRFERRFRIRKNRKIISNLIIKSYQLIHPCDHFVIWNNGFKLKLLSQELNILLLDPHELGETYNNGYSNKDVCLAVIGFDDFLESSNIIRLMDEFCSKIKEFISMEILCPLCTLQHKPFMSWGLISPNQYCENDSPDSMIQCSKGCNNVMLVLIKAFDKSTYNQSLLIDYLLDLSGLKKEEENSRGVTLETVVYVKVNGFEIYGRIIAQVSLLNHQRRYIIKFTSKRIEKNSKIYINNKQKGIVLSQRLQNTYECSLDD